MPSEVVHCVICDQRQRGARSKYTVIGTRERVQKVYKAYQQRYGKLLNHSITNTKVHVSCYKGLTYGEGPVSKKNLIGRPKHYPRPCNVSTASNICLYHKSPSIKNKKKNLQGKQHHSSITQQNLNLETINDCLFLLAQEVTVFISHKYFILYVVE